MNGTSLNKKQLSAIKVPYSLVKCDLPMNKARVYALKKILNFFSHIESDEVRLPLGQISGEARAILDPLMFELELT